MASAGAAADGVTEQLQARLAQAEAQLASGSDEQTALRSAFEQAVAQRDTLALRYAALKEALGTGDALTVAEADTTPGKGDAQVKTLQAAPLTLVLLAEHSAVADAALAALRQRLLRDGGLPPDIQGASRAAVEAHGAVRAVVSTLAAIHGDSAELARYRHARRHAGAVSSNDGQLLERCRQLEAQQEAHARQLTEAHAARDAALEQLSGAKARIEACQRAGREMQTVQQSMEADLARCRDALAAQAAELAAFKHAAEAREQEQCALVASLQTRVEATAGVATSELDVLRESVLKLRSQRDEARAAAAALTADVREARTALEQEEQVTAAASVELAAAHTRVEALEAKLEDAALQAVTAMEGLQDRLQEAEAGRVEAHAALSDSRARVDGLDFQLAEALSSLSTALSAEEASAGARAVLVVRAMRLLASESFAFGGL
jgi:chromosome segregation ATPase